MNNIIDFAFTARGNNHIKKDKVCEDSSGHFSDELMSIAVVADGHGSDDYPRTDRGSDFAVSAAISSVREFVRTVAENDIDIFEDSDAYLEDLTKNILCRWYEAVAADALKYPFSEEELSLVSDRYKRGYLSGECPEKAYGTTLICVCRTAEYWFGLQIGDGRCVCISDDDRVSEPIPWDDECEGKITTSLCDSDALEKFRYYLGKEIPAAVFMGTDGIDDSYSNSDELYVLYRAVLAIFAEYGEERGKAELEEFLPSFSKKGSGDDVSVAGIISGAVSPEFISMQKAYCEYSNAKAQRTETERAARRAADTLTYVLETMQKAKANYEQCLATVNKVRAEIEQIDREKQSVAERLEVAEKAFFQAREIYNNSVFAPIGEQAPAPGRAEDTCGGAEETEDD